MQPTPKPLCRRAVRAGQDLLGDRMKAVGMSRNRIAFIISNTTRHLALLRLADSLPATLLNPAWTPNRFSYTEISQEAVESSLVCCDRAGRNRPCDTCRLSSWSVCEGRIRSDGPLFIDDILGYSHCDSQSIGLERPPSPNPPCPRSLYKEGGSLDPPSLYDDRQERATPAAARSPVPRPTSA